MLNSVARIIAVMHRSLDPKCFADFYKTIQCVKPTSPHATLECHADVQKLTLILGY